MGALGARTKLWICSLKEYHQKLFRTNGVLASKNTLKKPPPTIFQKWGGYPKPLMVSVIREKLPPWYKIKSGHLTSAFLGAHKWAKVLRTLYVLGGLQTRGRNQKWLPHPCLLGGPQVGGCAT